MDLQQAQRELAADLDPVYGNREAALIADWVMEHLTGFGRLDRLTKSGIRLSEDNLKQYVRFRGELLEHRPVQYVLHECWFAGMKFYVDENVLIPRPETEELVEWASSVIAAGPGGVLLDIGTGSGCIAIALAGKLPSLTVYGCDVSPEALGVASRNATDLGARVRFLQLDFLDSSQWSTLPPVQWLVSNPPYIPLQEKANMDRHVAEAEPSQALFVPDSDPLVFYRALAGFATTQLLPGGAVFVEIHEDLAADTTALFKAAGFHEVTVRKDMQGKERMIKASVMSKPSLRPGH